MIFPRASTGQNPREDRLGTGMGLQSLSWVLSGLERSGSMLEVKEWTAAPSRHAAVWLSHPQVPSLST